MDIFFLFADLSSQLVTLLCRILKKIIYVYIYRNLWRLISTVSFFIGILLARTLTETSILNVITEMIGQIIVYISSFCT